MNWILIFPKIFNLIIKKNEQDNIINNNNKYNNVKIIECGIIQYHMTILTKLLYEIIYWVNFIS